jgi:hypothetical protein
MAGFLQAHGYDPGPAQRPILTGLISGVVATLPASLLLHFFGSLEVQSEILGLPVAGVLALGALVMAVAGGIYARLFGRAANDERIGWLFGTSFGFALWAAGGAMVLPILSGGLAPAGAPAMGLLLSLLIWGGVTGALVPFVHRPLRRALSKGAQLREVGPTAAAEGWLKRNRR